MTVRERLEHAEFLRQQGRTDECLRICNEILNEHLDMPEAIFLVGHCLIDSGKFGLAHALYMQFLRLRPNIGAGWTNLGRCYQEVHKIDEAERCFRRALKIEPDDPIANSNLGLVELNKRNPQEAIKRSSKAIEMRPGFTAAKNNLGMAYLMIGQWKEGWENFEASVGYDRDRRERVYGEEERWDGSKGKVVVAYGEQGIGDEISFASCIPDFVRDCKEAVIECDSRLEGLFKRSFPGAHVYGTRYREYIDWADKHKVEGRVSFATLPKFYRNRTEDFPGTPYLVADPQRRIQWRALLDSLGDKPKVGIAWTGGKSRTGMPKRSVALEALLPVLRQDATFVSLQYRDPTKEIAELQEKHGITVHHWPRAAEALDYDETAALVAELDCVVSVTTSAIHLAGSMGVPCLVLVPHKPRWFYGLEGETSPWYKSVELIRQEREGDWTEPINDAAVRMRKHLWR